MAESERNHSLLKSPEINFATAAFIQLYRYSKSHGGWGVGGSSIAKVPRDVPPARVCIFELLLLTRVFLFENFGQREVKSWQFLHRNPKF